MPLLRVNAAASGISMHDTARPVATSLARVARRHTGPVVIMVHGYKYAPGASTWCPHKKIFAFDSPHSWPRALGFEAEKIGIAFGWSAQGRVRDAAMEAEARGRDLAQLIRLVRKQAPDRSVHLLAHSLGASVVLSALSHLQKGDVARILLLAGAADQSLAEDALQSPAGRAASVLNLTSRENDLFDFFYETLVPGSRAIGGGIDAHNALTLQIDCTAALRALAELGHAIAPAGRRICHRSTYTRPGIMAFIADLLSDTPRVRFDTLRRAMPTTTAPRWARLPPLAALMKTSIMLTRSAKGTNHEHAY